MTERTNVWLGLHKADGISETVPDTTIDINLKLPGGDSIEALGLGIRGMLTT